MVKKLADEAASGARRRTIQINTCSIRRKDAAKGFH
jgi:hypothetical protein